MLIEVVQGNIEISPELRSHIDSRLRMAFAKHGRAVRNVSITFDATPRTPQDTEPRCLLEVRMKHTVKVDESGPDLFQAAERAIAAATRSVIRAVRQEEQRQKPKVHPKF